MTPTNLECLVHAQTLETLWAYYSQSGGFLYQEETKEAAVAFAEAFDRAADADGALLDSTRKRLGEDTDIREIVERLRSWGAGGIERAYDTDFLARFMLYGFITSLKSALLKDINFVHWPMMRWSSDETQYSASSIRWKSHLPRRVLHKDLERLIKDASSTQSIAVMGDIRRSQDLMTYASSPTDFSERMVNFIAETRRFAEERFGFFDKFTGDGFLLYFNEAICREFGENYLDCFVEFIREEMALAREVFSDWTTSIRKLPAKTVGLTIGADVGVIAFNDIQHHLVAVGDAIVWAARMSSAGNADEVVINNLLFAALQGRGDLQFAPLAGETKAGESFLAQRLSVESARMATT